MGKSTTTTVRLPLEVDRKWEELAQQLGMPKSSVVSMLLRSVKVIVPPTAGYIEFSGEATVGTSGQ